ncbi:hypothetical protein GCM10023083_90690 [Streptomyces phyllanthi]|uniref:hypothetical protein n=1 Tax=Streptomyces phyllanthi TaxID=1803180 RepID=UPI0018840439|nr:hypothetical protein [Streptomyces phyllanthi]
MATAESPVSRAVPNTRDHPGNPSRLETLYKKYFHDPIAADLLKERPKLVRQIMNTHLAPTQG